MSQRTLSAALAAVALLGLSRTADAQKFEPNYDEAKIPPYTLPDPLTFTDGSKVRTAEDWTRRRRPELMALFAEQMFGKAPARPETPAAVQASEPVPMLGGKALRRHVTIDLTGRQGGPTVDLMLVTPKGDGPFPTFVGLNFGGNYTVAPDPEIPLTAGWVPNDAEHGIRDNRASEAARGKAAGRWPFEQIIDRGYAVATAYYGDIDPDFDDGFKNGVHPFYRPEGQSQPEPDAWGSIAAWAWGLGRMMDYLQADPKVDAKRVIVMGHSRLGKTSLWAGATDERFALVISNDSGCGGAALSRRQIGETVGRINASFPHWFCDNFNQYSNNEGALPFDQHELIALIAPRPVLVCSAEDDKWADPKGEFLSALGADSVYRLLGTDGMGVNAMPGTNVLVRSTIGYHIRPGKHDVTSVDWAAYMDFADRHLRGR